MNATWGGIALTKFRTTGRRDIILPTPKKAPALTMAHEISLPGTLTSDAEEFSSVRRPHDVIGLLSFPGLALSVAGQQ